MLALPRKDRFVVLDPLSVYPAPCRVSVQRGTSLRPSTALLSFTASFQPEQPAEAAQPAHAAPGYWRLGRGHVTWTREEESWPLSPSGAHSIR